MLLKEFVQFVYEVSLKENAKTYQKLFTLKIISNQNILFDYFVENSHNSV